MALIPERVLPNVKLGTRDHKLRKIEKALFTIIIEFKE